MRPSLPKSKSGSHLSPSLPSPLTCSLVSVSNNKLFPAYFGRVPELWAVSWTLGGRRDPTVSRFSFFSPLSFPFFFLRLLLCCGEPCCSSPLSVSCSPAFLPDLETETHVGFWFEVWRGGTCPRVLCCHDDPSFSSSEVWRCPSCVWGPGFLTLGRLASFRPQGWELYWYQVEVKQLKLHYPSKILYQFVRNN